MKEVEIRDFFAMCLWYVKWCLQNKLPNSNPFPAPLVREILEDLADIVYRKDSERKIEEVIRPKEPLEEDVVDQLRSVVKKKKESDIKFKSGTSVPIDPESAKTILKTYDSLNSSKKKKMQDNMNKDTKSFLKILDFAFSNAK